MKRLASLGDPVARGLWIWRNMSSFERCCEQGRPRLLVDVSAIIREDAQTGIQRVVRAVWSELAKRSGTVFDAHPIYASRRRGYCYAPADFLDNPDRQLEHEPVAMGPTDQFLGLDLNAHLLPKYRRQLRAWRARGAILNVVVYDMLPLESPHWFRSATVRHFGNWFSLLVRDFDHALCISNHVTQALRRRVHRSSDLQVGRLLMGSDISASRPSTGVPPDAERVLELMHHRPAILMVGTIEPRKGYELALAAFDKLWKEDADAPDLVIVGKRGWKTGSLQAQIQAHRLFGNRLHWLDQVSDEALCRFYDAAKGVLVTSRGEGFGLPLVEAAAHRRYVLARDLPVFREQRLSNLLFFGDDEPGALGARVMDLLAASANNDPPAIMLPSWSESVDRLLVQLGLDEADIRPLGVALRQAS